MGGPCFSVMLKILGPNWTIPGNRGFPKTVRFWAAGALGGSSYGKPFLSDGGYSPLEGVSIWIS